MFSKYKPTWMVDAIYKITPAQLKNLGIKAVLTDLDNTLIAWNNPDGTEELLDWILEMRNAGIPVVVVSNNSSERVARAIDKFELTYVARALKPLAVGMNRAKKMLNLSDDEIVMIGDQIMTDIRRLIVRVSEVSWLNQLLKRIVGKHDSIVFGNAKSWPIY